MGAYASKESALKSFPGLHFRISELGPTEEADVISLGFLPVSITLALQKNPNLDPHNIFEKCLSAFDSD